MQNPTLNLAGDAAATRQVIGQAKGPVVLVGHSYGGVVITEAGNDPKVSKLVYIAAFAPDKGESVASLIKDPAPGAPVPPILPPQDGFLFLDTAKFAASFAADVEPDKAQFMAGSQVPWGVGALEGPVSEPAWRSKPSWYLVATDDRMIHLQHNASCRNLPAPRWSRAPEATPSTCRDRRRWQRSSGWPRRCENRTKPLVRKPTAASA